MKSVPSQPRIIICGHFWPPSERQSSQEGQGTAGTKRSPFLTSLRPPVNLQDCWGKGRSWGFLGKEVALLPVDLRASGMLELPWHIRANSEHLFLALTLAADHWLGVAS